MAATETTDLALGFTAPDFHFPMPQKKALSTPKTCSPDGPPWLCSCATIARL